MAFVGSVVWTVHSAPLVSPLISEHCLFDEPMDAADNAGRWCTAAK